MKKLFLIFLGSILIGGCSDNIVECDCLDYHINDLEGVFTETPVELRGVWLELSENFELIFTAKELCYPINRTFPLLYGFGPTSSAELGRTYHLVYLDNGKIEADRLYHIKDNTLTITFKDSNYPQVFTKQ